MSYPARAEGLVNSTIRCSLVSYPKHATEIMPAFSTAPADWVFILLEVFLSNIDKLYNKKIGENAQGLTTEI